MRKFDEIETDFPEIPIVTLDNGQEITSIDDLLCYDNPHLERYQQLIAREEARIRRIAMMPFQTQLSEWAAHYTTGNEYPFENSSMEILRQRLRGSVLIDLGGGIWDSIQNLARSHGVQTYIKIDRYLSKEEHPHPLTLMKDEENGEMRTIIINGDMLRFISALPTGHFHFTVNGIDRFVIQAQGYHEALADELTRIVTGDSMIFGKQSYIFAELRQFPALHQIQSERNFPHPFIFSKES